MSVPVELRLLGEVLAEYGFAYLLTIDGVGRPHAVAVRPQLVDGELLIDGIGAGTRRNAAARPQVALVWPPLQESGLSLIVDAAAEPPAAERGPLRVVPVSAIRHRPAG